MNKRIKLIEEEKINKDNKINEMEKRIERLEKYHKPKIQLTSCNLKNTKSIQPHILFSFRKYNFSFKW